MSLKSTTKLTSRIALGLLISMLATPLIAQAAEATRSSKSISYASSTEIDKATKDQQLKLADAVTLSPLVKQGFRDDSNVVATKIDNISYYQSSDFIIYNASTDLISDFNYDGFYHRFSVTIDADTVYNTSYVYAKLFLSYEGGPWNHYATSDSYHIYTDSELDAFVIESELADGFPPGYYDIRIELYDADYNELLVSYGPYDDASLSALPLEDSYYDDNHISVIYPIETEVVVTGRGSLGWWLLFAPVLIPVTRRLARK